MTLYSDCPKPRATATNEQLFATKKFPVTPVDGSQGSLNLLLNVTLLRYLQENKIVFEISRGEVRARFGDVEVVSDIYEDVFKPCVNISLSGFRELENGRFIIEKGAKIGIELVKPNEVTEGCVVSREITVHDQREAFGTMQLFTEVLEALRDGIIMSSVMQEQSRSLVILRFIQKMIHVVDEEPLSMRQLIRQEWSKLPAPLLSVP